MARLVFPQMKLPHPPVIVVRSRHPTTDDYERAEMAIDVLGLLLAMALGAIMAWGLITAAGHAPWF